MGALSTARWLIRPLLLPGRGLGVLVVGVRLVGLVMADCAARSRAQLAMPSQVAGNAADDGALNASLGLRRRDRAECQQQANGR